MGEEIEQTKEPYIQPKVSYQKTQDEKKERIKIWMAACLVIVAFSADAAEFVLEWLGLGLAINIVTTPAYTFLFWLWFKLLDVPFIASPKKFFTFAATCLAETIPALDAIGGFFWTIGTLIIVIMVRMEDKGGVLGELSGAAMGVMQKKYGSYKNVLSNPEKVAELRRGLGKNVFSISKEDIVSEAQRRNPRFSAEQYGRGVDALRGTADRTLGPQSRRKFVGLEDEGANRSNNEHPNNRKRFSGDIEQKPNTLDLSEENTPET